MNTTMPASQRGLSFTGFIVGAFILVLLSILGLKVIPAYMENESVKSLFNQIIADPEMHSASPQDIRLSFGKRASIENVKVITAEDIVIENNDGNLVLSASYAVKQPLVGNISLYIEFSPTSGK